MEEQECNSEPFAPDSEEGGSYWVNDCTDPISMCATGNRLLGFGTFFPIPPTVSSIKKLFFHLLLRSITAIM
jgi:hypothetical protein